MFGFLRPTCPVSIEEREWIETSWNWLSDEFGEDIPRNTPIVLPTDDFFPDPFDTSPEAIFRLAHRVCTYMKVDPKRIQFELFAEPELSGFLSTLPTHSLTSHGAAGLYRQSKESDRFVIALKKEHSPDPLALVATIAHELGHVHLLGDGRLSDDDQDHELVTDLITVFFGMGIFSANSAFSFQQWQGGFHMGWSSNRLGYLSEPMFGYALAILAWIRNEKKPAWAKYLDTNVKTPFKRALRYLNKGGQTLLPPKLRN